MRLATIIILQSRATDIEHCAGFRERNAVLTAGGLEGVLETLQGVKGLTGALP
jgi:hypothetical protein